MTAATPDLDLRTLLDGAQLPALPQSAIRLLELSQDPDNGPAEFAVPIESDPGLTGQVLRFVNSSYFGFVQEVLSIKLAISLVGIRTIKNFALWSAVFSLMPNPQCGPFELKRLWQDSLRRALFARRFGKLLGVPDAEDLFAVGLLQDMAVPLLAKELPDEYQMLLDSRRDGAVRLSALESESFGWTHAEAGGLIARGWKLPESFATMIENHIQIHELLESNREDSGQLAISLSALLPSTCDPKWPEGDEFVEAYRTLLPATAPPPEQVFRAVDDDFKEFAPVLKLAVPAKSLADSLAATVQASV